ncbi:MAG: hypothetical protein ACREE7_09930 [Dongiaceae bacterium]
MLRQRPGEHEAARPVDLEIFAGVLDILAVAPLREEERAADARIDVEANQLAQSRPELLPDLRDIEEGIEDPLRRCAEASDDANGNIRFAVHRNRFRCSYLSSGDGAFY